MSEQQVEDQRGDLSPAEPEPTGTPPEPLEDASAARGAADKPSEPTTPTGDEPTGPTDELAKVRREAADRRVKQREAEARAERVEGQLAAFQKGEAERLVGDRLNDPSDLWLGGVELDSLLAEDGTLDREAVTRAAAEVAKAHPSWAKPMPDLGGGARPPARSGPSFGQALKARR